MTDHQGEREEAADTPPKTLAYIQTVSGDVVQMWADFQKEVQQQIQLETIRRISRLTPEQRAALEELKARQAAYEQYHLARQEALEIAGGRLHSRALEYAATHRERDVLQLHPPTIDGGALVCRGCDQGYLSEGPPEWPCSTHRLFSGGPEFEQLNQALDKAWRHYDKYPERPHEVLGLPYLVNEHTSPGVILVVDEVAELFGRQDKERGHGD